MNDSQQVAAFILGKLRQAPMIGDESESVSSAKQWLTMIQNGQLLVVDPPVSKPEGEEEHESGD